MPTPADPPYFTRTPEGLVISLKVTPKASKNALEGLLEEEGKYYLKAKITAPPEDGKANKALLKFLSKTWKIPTSSMTLISGETSRYKRVMVVGTEAVSRLLRGSVVYGLGTPPPPSRLS
jgi:uncharacterized protein (TIGR00251 family)